MSEGSSSKSSRSRGGSSPGSSCRTCGTQGLWRVRPGKGPAHIRCSIAHMGPHAASRAADWAGAQASPASAGMPGWQADRMQLHQAMQGFGTLTLNNHSTEPQGRPQQTQAHLQGPLLMSYSSARTTSGATSGSRSGSSRPRRASSASPMHPPCQAVSLAPVCVCTFSHQ